MERMNNGKAVDLDDISVVVWTFLEDTALEFLTKLYNITIDTDRMRDAWTQSLVVRIFKRYGDVQSCSNYRGKSWLITP